jgi:cytidylate kinase
MSAQVIAIDGPAASGKSSVARVLAQQLGWLYVNTGNMFRAITWAVVRASIDVQDADAIHALNEQLHLDYQLRDGQIQITVDGHHVTDLDLNADAVNQAVSYVARVPSVRERLKADQRALTKHGHLVMEGRDIGTQIFPDSPYKFYITASEEVRQKRRAAQGHEDAVVQRDKLDQSRKNAPLAVAEGAIIIDSSEMTLEQVVAAVSEHLQLSI